MYHPTRFHVGDRISKKYALAGLPAGSCGTVQSVFTSVRGVYDVRFDPEHAMRIVFQSDLALIAPIPQAVVL